MTPGGSDTRETIACAPPLVCGCTLQRKCATHAEVTWAEINEAQVRDDARAVRAIQSFDKRFGGTGPGRWTFDGRPITDGVAHPLLLLHDNLNDLEQG